MKLIGITGGFCTGKTTVAGFFKELGAHIIDADKIVHQLYKNDRFVKSAILKDFGTEVFTRGKINRKKLSQRVFGNKKLRRLCDIVHPRVIKEIKKEAKAKRYSIIVIDAPLLIETGLHKMVDAIITVVTSSRKQLRRAAARGFSRKDVILRNSVQMPLREKVKFADFVVDNDKPKKEVKKDVEKIWNRLKKG